MVIMRCVGPSEFFMERVVFPFELLSFACPLNSEVKVWTHGLGGPELLESIQAEQLGVDCSSAVDQAAPIADTSPWELSWADAG
jgi:hypothetical protein